MDPNNGSSCLPGSIARALLTALLLSSALVWAATAAEPKPAASIDDMFTKCTKILSYGEVMSLSEPSKMDAVVALGILGDERALPLLIGHLENSKVDALRTEIVRALGNIGSAQAVPALEKALGDKYPHVRMRAAMALKKITGKEYDYDKTGLPDLPKLREVRKDAAEAKKTP